MFRKGTLLLMLLTVLSLLPAGVATTGASAQSDVQVDPNSPAGTQYDIPVRKARRDAEANDGKSNPDDPSLFGAGVQPESGSADDEDDSQADDKPESKDAKNGKDKEKAKDEKDETAAPATTGGSSGDGGTPVLLATEAKQETTGPGLLLAVLGIALALVAAATISGWLIRRRSS